MFCCINECHQPASIIDVGGKTYWKPTPVLTLKKRTKKNKKSLAHVDKIYNQLSKCSHLAPSC
jgi:hypothetical protein